MSVLREAFERQARSQRVRIDGAMLERKRRDMLAALGEAVYELARAGEVGDLEEVPEISDLIADIEYIDDRMDDADARPRRDVSDPDVVSAAEWAAGSGRRRFHHPEPGASDENMRVWRPVRPSARKEPPADQADEAAEEAVPEPTARGRSSRRRRSRRAAGGGIAFGADPRDSLDDDDDLEQYMHPDDLSDGDEG